MQIHSGLFKGRRIKTVKNAPYRPTTALVRKSLFDIIGSLSGKDVLDLFAGTGIIGFEASSRGAQSVTFVESSIRAMALLKINGSLINGDNYDYIKNDAIKFLKKENSFDFIFADPPYAFNELDELVLLCLNHLRINGVLVIESSLKDFSIDPYRVKEYGDTQLSFWRKS